MKIREVRLSTQTSFQEGSLRVKTLKEKNVADFINQKDVYGNTPLYLAVIAENEEIVTLLCNAGADVNLTYANDNNVLAYARELGNEKIVNILIASGAGFKKG